MINRQKFYNIVRPELGPLSQKQVEGFEIILTEWESDIELDLRKLAYILATAWHETARTMQPIEEYGRGKNRPYGRPDPRTGKAYFGRGYVQLTWYDNYKKMGLRLGIDLLNEPELALQPSVAVRIMFEGMYQGMFTGKKLSTYFNGDKADWINARRIINLLDKAKLIAGYGKMFHSALIAV